MAITHLVTQYATPLGSATSAIDTTGATLLVVCLSWYSNGTSALVPTDSKGNTWTGGTIRDSGTVAQRYFYCANPTVGTGHTFTLSAPGGAGSTFPVFTVHAFAGITAASPLLSEAGGTATSGTSLAAGSVTPPSNGCLVVSGWAGMNGATAPSVDSGLTQTTAIDRVFFSNISGGAGYLIQATAASINPTWAWTGTDHVAESVAVFGPAATVTPPGPGFIITLDGIECRFRHDTLEITSTINGIDTAAGIVDILDDEEIPAIDQELIIERDGVVIFGGVLTSVEYGAITADASKDLSVRVGAEDFNQYADRRYVPRLESAVGVTLKSVIEDLIPYLSAYGVTLHAAQGNGPTIPPFTYEYRKVVEIFDELATVSGWVWEIDYDKVLRFWEPGDIPAAFDLEDGDGLAMGDIKVSPQQTEYANRIILRVGPTAPADHVFGWNGDGTTNAFVMYFPITKHYGFVWVRDPLPDHSETLGAVGSGAQWEFHDGPPQYISRVSGPPPATDTGVTNPTNQPGIQLQAFVPWPYVAIAEDTGEQAAHGIYERLIDDPVPVHYTYSDAKAAGLLAKHLSPRRIVTYKTREPGLHVGQTQHLTIVRRDLDADFLITDLVIRNESYVLLTSTVTAQESVTYQGSWRDVYKLWAATLANRSSATSTGGGDTGTGGTPLAAHAASHETGGTDAIDLLAVSVLSPVTASRLIGRGSAAGAGDAEEITPGLGLTIVGTDLVATAIASGVFGYIFNTTTTEGSGPPNQRIMFNAAHPYTAVTKVWADFDSSSSEDLYWGWMKIKPGSDLMVQDKDTHTMYAEFRTTGAPIDKGTYVELPVTWLSNGTALAVQAVLVRVTATGIPGAHASTHQSGGSDLIALDTLGATTDITTLNSSTTAHGLLPKLTGTVTDLLRGDGTWAPRGAAVDVVIDGGGSTITTGTKGYLRIPFTGTITGVTVLSIDAAATAGSIVVDLWKDTYANYPPTGGDSIVASAPPTLSSANKSVDTTLTGWTTAVTVGDVLGVSVTSATTVTRVLVSLAIRPV